MVEDTSTPCEICCNLQPKSALSELPSHESTFESGMQVLLRRVKDFEVSGHKGCKTCNFTCECLAYFGLPLDDPFPITLRIHAQGACDLLVTSRYLTLQFYTPIGHLPPWGGIIHSQEMSSGPASQQAFDFILRCLHECDQQHPSCKLASADLPTRLIEIGGSEANCLRLVESADILHEPYVALSYCWGKGGSLTTTKSSMQKMKEGMKITWFPKTLQDAIAVCKALNVRYIWIDAICIIQDSISDWEIESSRMATVYQNAYLTIAVGTAADASEGFLHRKHLAAEHRPPFHSAWKTNSGRDTVLAARITPVAESHSLDQEEDALPLALRGWTLQEDILSTRVLTYSQHELWWTCKSEKKCECHTWNFLTKQNVLRTSTAKDAFRKWHDTVGEFSVRELTNAYDKLPALSGIARVIQDMTQSSYLGGVWKDNIVRDLNWSYAAFLGEDIQSMPNSRLKQYRAPSFSWASVEHTGVAFDEGYFLSRSVTTYGTWHPACVLISAGCTPTGQNPLGRVQDGFVILQGRITKATLRVETNELGEHYTIAPGNSAVRFTSDTRLEEFEAVNHEGFLEKSVRRSPFGSRSRSAKAGAPVFLFHLGSWHLSYDRAGRRNYLVLGKSFADMSKYERLGHLRADFIPNMSSTDAGNNDSNIKTITII
ncbi:HET-domain-containing protein [Xylariaceae sp. AK1471]|nr:HET-domain-containing protein [Xylariaceae sp. AK1471]